MILLVKASLVIIFLLSFYKLFLEKESFFSANRIYLLGCLVLACILPFIVLPKITQHQGYVDNILSPAPILKIDKSHIETYSKTPEISSNADEIQLENDKNSSQSIIADQGQIKENSKDLSEHIQTNEPPAESNSKGILFWLLCLYLFGVIVLIINLLGQVVNVTLKVMRNPDQIEDEGIVIVNMQGDVEPCSFFKYIFINPSSYDFDTYEQIIAHEKVHVSKRHTIDLLLSEIAIIILWFNPFIWLLRKEVEKNIEYQTDHALINQEQDQKEAYQLNLVKIACNTSPLAITTNYNQSLIKQRILRMNAKRSNQFSYWKYAFCMPLVFVLLLILNRPLEINAQSGDQIAAEMIENGDDVKKVDDNADKLTEMKNEVSDQPAIDKNLVRKKSKEENTPKIMDSKLIADCEEFEKAVAAGDLVRVKEILKTLDPDCLKIKKNDKSNLSAVKNLVEKKKSSLNQKQTKASDEVKKNDVCERLKLAVKNRIASTARDIILNEDISCLQDADGGPSTDLALVRGLLNHGAKLDIYGGNMIKINPIGFEIGIEDAEAVECQDPHYLRLVEAIKANNDFEIRKILAEESLTCPLNINGVRNDFIFIKELMRYGPSIINRDRKGINVGGVGVEIDMDDFKKKESTDINRQGYLNQMDILSEIENSLPVKVEEKEISCVELIDAIDANNISFAQRLVPQVDLDCFHRITRTLTNDEDKLITSTMSTPLISAIRKKNYTLSKLIMDNDADINYSGDGKETPLIAAVKTEKSKLVKLLVEAGAALNSRDGANFTALDYARLKKMDSIYDYLKSKGAK